jgi:hypothetical protein
VITTEEVVAVNVEAQADLVEEVLVVVEVSDQEKKVDLGAIEIALHEQNVQTDLEEKAVSIEIAQLQKENLVLFKEKKELQDVLLKEVLIDQLVVHSKQQKTEDLEKAKDLIFIS